MIRWDNSLDTGIDIIDHQHRRIVLYINMLDMAIQQQTNDIVPAIIDELLDYTNSHFSFEENLLQKKGYRQLEEHRYLHERFSGKIMDYRVRMLDGGDVAKPLLDELLIWLKKHIKEDDGDYVSLVKDNEPDQEWLTRAVVRHFGASGDGSY